jgi:uncharacterized protein involved in tolerance to divalent cations
MLQLKTKLGCASTENSLNLFNKSDSAVAVYFFLCVITIERVQSLYTWQDEMLLHTIYRDFVN